MNFCWQKDNMKKKMTSYKLKEKLKHIGMTKDSYSRYMENCKSTRKTQNKSRFKMGIREEKSLYRRGNTGM